MSAHPILKWTARLTGLLCLGFFSAFFWSEGLPGLLNTRNQDLMQALPLLLAIAAAFTYAWFRPATGGKWMIAGAAGIALFFLLRGDGPMAFYFGFPALAVGSCFLASVNRRLI